MKAFDSLNANILQRFLSDFPVCKHTLYVNNNFIYGIVILGLVQTAGRGGSAGRIHDVNKQATIGGADPGIYFPYLWLSSGNVWK